MRIFNALLIGSIFIQQHIAIDRAYAESYYVEKVQVQHSNSIWQKIVYPFLGNSRNVTEWNPRPWENQRRDPFYEQEFVKSQEFKNLSQLEQINKLADAFEERKWAQEIKETGKNLAISAFIWFIYGFAKHKYNRYAALTHGFNVQPMAMKFFAIVTDMQKYMGDLITSYKVIKPYALRWPIPFFLAQSMISATVIIQALRGAYRYGLISKVMDAPKDVLMFVYNLIVGKRSHSPNENLELEYFIKKSKLPEELQKYIEYNLEKLNNPSTLLNEDKIKQSIKNILTIHGSTAQVPNLSLDKFDQEFRGYHKNVYDAYRMFYVAAAIGNASNVMVQLLMGEPGTGKTVSVEKFASVLNGHVIKISGSHSLDTLFGSSEDWGVLVSQMAAADDDRPMILFIDEFDRGNPNIEALLKILDASKKTYFNNYYQCELPLPNLRIVAGNKGINDKALLNRVDVVEYTGFTPEYKKKILLEKLKNNLDKFSKNGFYTMSIDELKAEDHAVIDQIIANDQDIGFRTSEKILYRFAAHLIDKKYNPTIERPDFVSILKQQNQHLQADFIR